MNVDLAPGMRIADRYRLERELGRGAFGVVMLATHERLGHQVAIKFLARALTSSAEIVERFQREGQAAVSVAHPAVVEVLDLGSTPDGTPYLVMEYLEGKTLREVMDAVGAVPASIASAVLVPLLEALAAAHAAGVVHRDLKPSNVMLATSPRCAVKLLDFGVARLVNATGLTRQGVPIGTPNYMAPEQARDARTATPASDLYSVGTMLFELLSGRLPFEAASATEMMSLVVMRPAPSLATVVGGLDPRLVQLTDALLAKAPAARPATAAAVREVLLAAAPPDVEGLWTHVIAPERAAVAPTHVRAPSVKPDQYPAPTDRLAPGAAEGPASAPPPSQALRRLGIAAAVVVLAGVVLGVLAPEAQHQRQKDDHSPQPVAPRPAAQAATEPPRAVVSPRPAEASPPSAPRDAATVAEERFRNAAILKRAERAMLKGDLDGAWQEIRGCLTDGVPCPEAEPLIRQLELEPSYSARLAEAEAAGKARDWKALEEALDKASGTRAFRAHYLELRRRPGKGPAPKKDSPAALLREGQRLRDEGRLPEAQKVLEKCTLQFSTYSPCRADLFSLHKSMGRDETPAPQLSRGSGDKQ